MLKKRIWFVFSSLLVLVLTLSACTSTTETTQTTTATSTESTSTVVTTSVITTAVTPTVTTTTESANMVDVKLTKLDGTTITIQKEQPKYGGFFRTTLNHRNATDFFDPVISNIGGHLYSINYEYLFGLEWQRGPSGTNEFSATAAYIPDAFLGGQLAESWEIIDINSYRVHIRKGIHFQNKAPMNGRELTAYDVVYTILRGKADPRFSWYFDHSTAALEAWKKAQDPQKVAAHLADLEQKGLRFEDWRHSYVYAEDKYTFIYRNSFTPSVGAWRNMESIPIYGKEAVDAAGGNLSDWRNQVSTGPWMVTDCVPNSSVTWIRNPNYWQHDPFFPENQLPYADGIRGFIINDTQTYLAALRTRKLDWGGADFKNYASFKEQNPDMHTSQNHPTGSFVIFMRTDIAPFNDLRVRQALMLGIDQIGIVKDYYQNNAILLTWPSMPYHTEYVPLEQLPGDLASFYGRDVERAKKLLAEAGYPNGFKTTLGSYTDPIVIDLLSIVVEQLSEIGVEVEYKNYEGAVHDSILYSRKYPGMHFTWWGNNSPDGAQGGAAGGNPNSISNFSNVVDPKAEEFNKWYWNSLDVVERQKRLREENLRIMGLWWVLPLPQGTGGGFWSPWVKGFSGESSVVSGSEPGLGGRIKYIWIDEQLKKQMGY